MNPPDLSEAHRQFLVLGLELGLVLALATVAENAPGWGPPVLMLLVLLWAMFLFQHAESLRSLLGFLAPTNVSGGGGGNLVP